MARQPENYKFEVRIDGNLVEYEVLADSVQEAESKMLRELERRGLEAGTSVTVLLIVGGVIVGLALLRSLLAAIRARGFGFSIFGGGNGTPGLPKKGGLEVDALDLANLLDDGPQALPPLWPWRQVFIGNAIGQGAGPLADIDKSWRIVVYTDAPDIDRLRVFPMRYIPGTQDTPERAGQVVLVFPVSTYPIEDLPNGGIIDVVVSPQFADERFATASVRAGSIEEAIAGIKKEQANTLGQVWGA